MEIPGYQQEPGSGLQGQGDKPVGSPRKGALERPSGKGASCCLFYTSISPLGPFLTGPPPEFFFAVRPLKPQHISRKRVSWLILMDTKHLGISSALLCLPAPGWTRPCSAPHRVAQCLFTPGGVSKPPRHRLTSGSRGEPGKPRPSPCLSPEACRWAVSGSQHQHPALGSERQSRPHGSQAKALVAPLCQRCSGRLGQPGVAEGGRQLLRLGQRRRHQATASEAGAERGHQPGTALLACEKQGGSALLLPCHFCISSPRSMSKLRLGLPLSP